MNLRNLKDSELLVNTKQLVSQERKLLTRVLHHLKEVERRKLFSDLGHSSLFYYAVKELGYSEGQAGRRIQAMRVIKELPEVEQKNENGTLSLSNLSQAQSYFREVKKAEPKKVILTSEKLQLIEKLENKSAREGQKLILDMQPTPLLPKERERQVSSRYIEVKFVMDQELKHQLEKVKSLLGPKAQNMNFSELVDAMATTTIETLENKRFGEKRMAAQRKDERQKRSAPKLAPKSAPTVGVAVRNTQLRQNRYIPSVVKQEVWFRDKGKCTNCESNKNLHYDHIQPLALGGSSEVENLRLLCFNCNHRQAIHSFGIEKMESIKT